MDLVQIDATIFINKILFYKNFDEKKYNEVILELIDELSKCNVSINRLEVNSDNTLKNITILDDKI